MSSGSTSCIARITPITLGIPTIWKSVGRQNIRAASSKAIQQEGYR